MACEGSASELPEDVLRYAETHRGNNRVAAYILAIERVAHTLRQRGIYA